MIHVGDAISHRIECLKCAHELAGAKNLYLDASFCRSVDSLRQSFGA
jgi:hypothetical protein